MHERKIELNISIPLVRSFTYQNIFCIYMTIKLSQLMLNLYVVSRTGSFSRHAVHMLSLCEYLDL